MQSSDLGTNVEGTEPIHTKRENLPAILPSVLLGIVWLGAFGFVFLPFLLPFDQIQSHTISFGAILMVGTYLTVMALAGFFRLRLIDTSPSDKYITGGIFFIFLLTAIIMLYSMIVLGEVGFWFMSLIFMIFLGIALGIRYSHRKTRAGLLSGKYTLAHWTYSAGEWSEYALRDPDSIQNTQTLLGSHEVIVGDSGIIIDGKLNAWNTYGMSLYEIKTVKSPVLGLKFTYRTEGGFGSVDHSLFIPVPRGHLEEAKNLVLYFWSAGLKIEDRAGLLTPDKYELDV